MGKEAQISKLQQEADELHQSFTKAEKENAQSQEACNVLVRFRCRIWGIGEEERGTDPGGIGAGEEAEERGRESEDGNGAAKGNEYGFGGKMG